MSRSRIVRSLFVCLLALVPFRSAMALYVQDSTQTDYVNAKTIVKMTVQGSGVVPMRVTLPAGVTQHTPLCTQSGNILQCNSDSGSFSFDLSPSISNGMMLDFVFEAGGQKASISYTFAASLDLSVDAAAPARYTPGSDVELTISVTNNGPVVALLSGFAFSLPSHLADEYVTSVKQTAGTPAMIHSDKWAPFAYAPTVNEHETLTLVVTIRTSPTHTSTTTRTVLMTSNTDTNPTDNSRTIVLNGSSGPTPVTDVRVTVSGPASLPLDQSAEYRVTLRNDGNAPADNLATGIRLSFLAPGYPVNATSGTTCTISPLRCTTARLEPGTTAEIWLNVSPLSFMTAGQLASVVADATVVGDPTPDNNSAALVLTIAAPAATPAMADLAITEFTFGSAPIYATAPFTYLVRIRNVGTADANDVTTTLTLPAGASLLNAPAECRGNGAAVVCTAAVAVPQQELRYTLLVSAPAAAGKATSSLRVTTSSADAQPANDAQSLSFDVIPAGRRRASGH